MIIIPILFIYFPHLLPSHPPSLPPSFQAAVVGHRLLGRRTRVDVPLRRRGRAEGEEGEEEEEGEDDAKEVGGGGRVEMRASTSFLSLWIGLRRMERGTEGVKEGGKDKRDQIFGW